MSRTTELLTYLVIFEFNTSYTTRTCIKIFGIILLFHVHGKHLKGVISPLSIKNFFVIDPNPI